MTKKPLRKRKPLLKTRGSSLAAFVSAFIIYVCFAFYLYQPHFRSFSRIQYLLVISPALAGLGCYLLSRRWIGSYLASFLAGAVYGFGPFILGLGKYHPAAGLFCAMLPWLFCPAAFAYKNRFSWLNVPLAVMPFAAVIIFFQLAAQLGFFPVPTQIRLGLKDFAGLIFPLVLTVRNANLLGFFHIPIAPLILGFSILLKARRLGILTIIAAGLILVMCPCFFGVSPVIWLAIPLLCCCVLIGVGSQTITSAGFADRKWFWGISMVMAFIAIATLLLGTKYAYIFAGLGANYVRLFAQTAKMYILAAVTMAGVYILARSNLRLTPLRWITFCLVIGLDIFFSARFIVDHLL